MYCLELTIVRLDLSSNLLTPHAFACRILVWFVSYIIIFGNGKIGNNKDQVFVKCIKLYMTEKTKKYS